MDNLINMLNNLLLYQDSEIDSLCKKMNSIKITNQIITKQKKKVKIQLIKRGRCFVNKNNNNIKWIY
jgi:hypothetical protein